MSEPANFRLRLLGAGGAFSRRFGTTCSVLTLPGQGTWLIDCGRQAPDQLHNAGMSWHEIDGQIVTHVHGDHVYGMEDFAFSRFYFPGSQPGSGPTTESVCDQPAIINGGPKPRLVTHSAVRGELWEVLGPSLRYLDGASAPDAGQLSDYFEICEAASVGPVEGRAWPQHEAFALGKADLVGGGQASIRIEVHETEHIRGKPCFGLLISADIRGQESSFWWSGDGLVDGGFMASIVDRVTLFFQDCSFSPAPNGVHAHIDDIAALPAAIRNKMIIMHHDDDVERHRPRVEGLGLRMALPDSVFDLTTGRAVPRETPAAAVTLPEPVDTPLVPAANARG